MERNEAATGRRHAEVLTTIRDAMEMTHIRECLASLEAERDPKLQRPAQSAQNPRAPFCPS